MVSLVTKYMNPFWYMYNILLKFPLFILMLPINIPIYAWKLLVSIWDATVWAWNWSDKLYVKLFMVALAVWTAVPGTWLWVFTEVLKMVGYEEEVNTAVNAVVFVGKAMFEAGKLAYHMIT